MYDQIMSGSEDGEAPKFRQRGRDAWLYYASDGRWHFGFGRAAARSLPGNRLRSQECQPGTLPVDVRNWEVRGKGAGCERCSFLPSRTRPGATLQSLSV